MGFLNLDIGDNTQTNSNSNKETKSDLSIDSPEKGFFRSTKIAVIENHIGEIFVDIGYEFIVEDLKDV